MTPFEKMSRFDRLIDDAYELLDEARALGLPKLEKATQEFIDKLTIEQVKATTAWQKTNVFMNGKYKEQRG